MLKGYKDLAENFLSTRKGRNASADATKSTKVENDWIPTEAVSTILKIREKFDSKMTETAISQILYELNMIWRKIMRNETEAIKRRLGAQIQDLRRQVITKQCFDKGELLEQITR